MGTEACLQCCTRPRCEPREPQREEGWLETCPATCSRGTCRSPSPCLAVAHEPQRAPPNPSKQLAGGHVLRARNKTVRMRQQLLPIRVLSRPPTYPLPTHPLHALHPPKSSFRTTQAFHLTPPLSDSRCPTGAAPPPLTALLQGRAHRSAAPRIRTRRSTAAASGWGRSARRRWLGRALKRCPTETAGGRGYRAQPAARPGLQQQSIQQRQQPLVPVSAAAGTHTRGWKHSSAWQQVHNRRGRLQRRPLHTLGAPLGCSRHWLCGALNV